MVPTVLIVDDEKHTREGLQQALSENYDVTVAASADEAFNLFEAQAFDVVLTDLRMPGKSGLKIIDKALSLLVMTFIPDPARAVREMMRVTRPGGAVAAAVWDYGGGMEMLRVFWDEAVAFDPVIEPRDERHLPLCKPGELGALWRLQGLEDVEEAPLEITLHFTSFDDFWTPFLLGQGPAGSYAASLPEPRRAVLEQRLRGRVLGGGPDRPFDLKARVWAVKGTVPQR